MSYRLLPEQIESYRRQGFLSLPRLAGDEELSHLRELFLRLFAEEAGRYRGDQFDMAGTDEDGAPAKLPQILNPSRYAEELLATPLRAVAQQAAEDLLGGPAELDFEHAILKPPRVGYETSWHQDEAYWDPGFHYQSLSLWVPLQEATVENGCLQFIPGSHRRRVLPHHTLEHDPRIHALTAEGVDAGRAVACPLPAGAATVHHHRTLHYAGPNRTDQPRLAYIFVFALPPRPRHTKRAFPWLQIRKTAAQAREKAALQGRQEGTSHPGQG